jgi:hypothetical protein
MHVLLYKPKLHRFIMDQQLMNFNGEQHHASKLLCNVLSFTIIVLTKTVLYVIYWAFKTLKCFIQVF